MVSQEQPISPACTARLQMQRADQPGAAHGPGTAFRCIGRVDAIRSRSPHCLRRPVRSQNVPAMQLNNHLRTYTVCMCVLGWAGCRAGPQSPSITPRNLRVSHRSRHHACLAITASGYGDRPASWRPPHRLWAWPAEAVVVVAAISSRWSTWPCLSGPVTRSGRSTVSTWCDSGGVLSLRARNHGFLGAEPQT